MAQLPLLQLSDVSLSFGGNPLFSEVNAVLHRGDRIALVGRNGSGKSTLLKVLAGQVEPDGGSRALGKGIGVAYLDQEPDLDRFETLGDYAMAGLPPGEDYRVERVAEGLRFDLTTPVSAASGGERRRAALARIWAEEHDLYLLDEPTNHLDIAAIAWLEQEINASDAGFVIISHDRMFLRNLTRATLWLDRGELRRQDQGFETFDAWRDRVWDEEDTARHKLDRKIKAEARWAVEGISARRKRNQGRVRALQGLRQQRADMIARSGAAALGFEAGKQSGKKVIELNGVAKAFEGRPILRNFSFRVMRGDRIAIVGPNGAGKSTLIKLMTGEIEPDAGEVVRGTALETAVFDQSRSALDPERSLWDSLTGDPSMRVSGRADQVMVRGEPRHVVGYLKDFLFSEGQARAPVRSLSGGEKARLLLARLMAKPSNLLVLDEPTNDLDVETLDLLQEIVADFDGTVLVVSHDRDFIDRVATATVVIEPGQDPVVYAGGWTDYASLRSGKGAEKTSSKPAERAEAARAATPKSGRAIGLSFTEKHRLAELPDVIARLEVEIAKLTELLSDGELFSREPMKFAKATEALAERQNKLSAAEDEWLTLEVKAEAGN